MIASTPALTSAADHVWSGGGGGDAAWDNPANWIGGAPDGDDRVIFNNNSTASLVNTNDLGEGTLTGMSIQIADPPDDVTINGDSITLISADPTIDMISATRDLSINAPLVQTGFTYYNVAAGRTLTLAGEISGDCPLCRFRKVGPGLLIAAGPILSKENWIIDGTVRIAAGFSVPANAFWGLSGDAVLDLNDNDVTFGSVAGGDNTVIKLGSATVTLNQTGSTFCSGDIEGTGNFVKLGTGTYYIYNETSYTGSTTVGGGTLEIRDAMSSTGYQVDGGTLMLGAADVLPDTSTVTVAAGAVFDLNDNSETIGFLNGSGSALTGTGMLTVSTGLSPGDSPGTISTGNITLANGSSLTIDLNGTAAGTDYDRVDVTGTVTLDAPDLNLAFGYSPGGGESFIIINNDAADAVTGTCNGLAEGAIFSAGGVQLSISYAGGDGNDVVVSVLPALAVTKTGPGTGRVSGTPGAIDCGAVCSDTFIKGTNVTLSAHPDADSQFEGWAGGGCAGTGDCAVAMDTHQAVTATFSLTTTTTSAERIPSDDGPGCRFAISPQGYITVAGEGGTGSISVTPNNESCIWSAWSGADWITITRGGNDTRGSGTAAYVVAANTGSGCRYGTITLAMQKLLIRQEGTLGTPATTTAASNGASTTTTVPLTTTTTLPATTTTAIPATTTTTAVEDIPCPAELLFGADSYEALLLRRYRDEILAETPEGRQQIRLYYRFGPAISNLLERNPECRTKMRELITILQPYIERQLEGSPR